MLLFRAVLSSPHESGGVVCFFLLPFENEFVSFSLCVRSNVEQCSINSKGPFVARKHTTTMWLVTFNSHSSSLFRPSFFNP